MDSMESFSLRDSFVVTEVYFNQFYNALTFGKLSINPYNK